MIPTRAAALTIVLAACSAATVAGPIATSNATAAPATGGPSVTSATRLDCADPIAARHRPDAGFQVVGHALALRTARSSSTYLDTAPSGAPSTSTPLFAKSGLLVRTGTRSTVTVPAGWRGKAAAEWGNTKRRRPTTRLVVARCPGADRWIAFPGGYLVRRPVCLALDVRVAGRTQRIHVGVGTGCRGQHPPPGPPTG